MEKTLHIRDKETIPIQVKERIKELWTAKCINCGSSEEPKIVFFENDHKMEYRVSCKLCEFGISCLEIKEIQSIGNQKHEEKMEQSTL